MLRERRSVKTKRMKREPRPKLPTEIPLDDGAREGTEAFRRVWHATSIRHTPEMARTPRKVLEERALTGNWSAFPTSPAPYFAEFRSAVGEGWYDDHDLGQPFRDHEHAYL